MIVIKDRNVLILKSFQQGFTMCDNEPQCQFENITVNLHISFLRCRMNTYYFEKKSVFPPRYNKGK